MSFFNVVFTFTERQQDLVTFIESSLDYFYFFIFLNIFYNTYRTFLRALRIASYLVVSCFLQYHSRVALI